MTCTPPPPESDPHDRFAAFVATLGRGPGRSRALSREEAREAFGMVLDGVPDPLQVGAFLMLLRYRGEDPEEITGMVQAARARIPRVAAPVMLDWPSYGAGRTRTAPWFLLAALALARSGIPVLMHGTNAFSGSLSVAAALGALGLAPATDAAQAARMLRDGHFAYLPLAALSPAMDRLIGLRRLFGLRSPVNTVARLLDPADAPAGVDGVFHPPYVDLHLGVAERMARPALLVLKGSGGEAERNPAKAVTARLWRREQGRSEIVMPPLLATTADGSVAAADLAAVWRGTLAPASALATVRATIAMALLATGRCATADAAEIGASDVWETR